MSNVDFGRYKRIVKLFWDPEPKNDDSSQSSIWCLGREYSASPKSCEGETAVTQHGQESEVPITHKEEGSYVAPEKTINVSVNGGRESTPSRTGGGEEGGWPKEFLDDFESRPWMTYRSNFPAIKKSNDVKASASMSLSVRLRSQLDQGGFTSDTGWGCMIRSGQSVLANTLVMLRLGRGWGSKWTLESMALISIQIGGEVPERTRNEKSFLYSPTTQKPRSQYKDSWNTALWRVVNIRASGSDPLRRPDASSKSTLSTLLRMPLTACRALSDQYGQSGLKVYMNGDGADVYEDSFTKLAKAKDETFTPTLILLGIRLGIDRVTPVYWEALKAALRLPQSIGIAG